MKAQFIPLMLAMSISSSGAQENTSADWTSHGNDLIHRYRFEDAIRAYDKALEINKSNAAALVGRSEALLHMGRYSESLQSSDNALSLNPSYTRAWVCRGVALLGLGDLNGSRQAYDRAIEIDPDYSVAWNNKAWLAYKQDQYQEAVDYSDKAIGQLKHELAATLDTKASALSKLGKNEEALRYIDQVIELAPDNSIAWTHKGDILKAMGDQVGAEAAYARVKEMPKQSLDEASV